MTKMLLVRIVNGRSERAVYHGHVVVGERQDISEVADLTKLERDLLCQIHYVI